MLAEIPVGERPWSLAKAPLANEVFVANKGSATISVIDTLTLAVVRTIALPRRVAAARPRVRARQRLALRGARGLARVEKRSRRDGRARGQRRALGPAAPPRGERDGQELYVTNFVSPPLPGEDGAVLDVSGGPASCS